MPRLVSLYLDADGSPWLAHGSPHAVGDLRALLHAAFLPDIGPLKVERARQVVRTMPPDEMPPHPETCVPYREANGLGFVVRPRLPLLFVRNRRGELLPDAATALAYARDNEVEFETELSICARYAGDVLDVDVVRRAEHRAPLLFRDLAQPYSLFGPGHYAIPAGLYAQTDLGIGTFIGPPLNRGARLPVVSGMVRTDWHHHALFVVIGEPVFEGRSMLVPPEDDLAQVWFAAYGATAAATLEHSSTDRGGEPGYEARWWSLVGELGRQRRGISVVRRGLASVSLSCPHCSASITEAVDEPLPVDHESAALFVPAYKEMRREQEDGGREAKGIDTAEGGLLPSASPLERRHQ